MFSNNLIDNILNVCKVLEKYSVEYIIVGGTALALHGHYRMTRLDSGVLSNKHDFDFWYNPSYENYYNLLRALNELGIDIKKFKEEMSPNPTKSFFKHEFDEFEVDFLPGIKGLEKFNTSYLNCEESEINGIEIPILSLEDLMKSKEATGREKDIADLIEIKALLKNKE